MSPAGSLATVDGANDYTHAALVRVLAAAIAEVAPERVGTTDGTLAYGDDHNDHIASGMFVLEALHAAHGAPQVRMYRGYSVYQTWSTVPEPEERNLPRAEHDEKTRIMDAYASLPAPGSLYDEWCWRHYFTTSVVGAPGELAQGDRCLDVSGGSATSGAAVVASACSGSSSQRWTVQADGRVVGIGGLCLTIDASGTQAMIAGCTGAPEQTWTLLDNGQLRGAGATCVTLDPDGATLRATTCRAQQVGSRLTVSSAQRWTH